MQLSKLYSDNKLAFSDIEFHCGDKSSTINVIYGDVTDSSDEKRDSHNLGKTTLIHLLDFMFLLNIAGKNHFLETHKSRFESFAFYLEVALNDGDFVTIRRSVRENSKIAIKRHQYGAEDLTSLHQEEWDHFDLDLPVARELLDGLFSLNLIQPYDYRKALTYFLRSQDDYSDVLQLKKFQMGQHVYWKPFVMTLLGFDERFTKEKYEIDVVIVKKEEEKKKKESEYQLEKQDLLRLKAEIQNKRNQLNSLEEELDKFQFSNQEKKIMHELVDTIDITISRINESLYNIQTDIRNIESALKSKISFKLKDIEEIFHETKIHFPDQIKQSYENLLLFNKSVTRERDSTLRARLKVLIRQRDILLDEKRTKDAQRQQYRSILDTTDALEKYKALQKTLSKQRADVVYMEAQYEKLEIVSNLELEISALKRQRGEIIDGINLQVKKGSKASDKIAEHFSDYCKRVLDHDGLFYVKQNNVGNVEFMVELKEPITSKPSRQSEGKSYKQLICALFDLSILKTYQNSEFYHFVYHDGILEGLDDRKKRLFLGVVREAISEGNIQYILSVIDSDVPRDANGARLDFTDEEIVLRLHDDGNAGRLFKMPEF